MFLKIIAFLTAAIPLFLFIRAVFFQRTTRINEGLKEFKKQANLAVSILLFLIGCVVVFAVGKLVVGDCRFEPAHQLSGIAPKLYPPPRAVGAF